MYSLLVSMHQVKQLTADVDLITEAIRGESPLPVRQQPHPLSDPCSDLCPPDSSLLQLDEEDEKVRAVPEKRCVLILREIPKETPKKVQLKPSLQWSPYRRLR